MPSDVRPAPGQAEPPPSPVPARAALEAAWRAGQAGAILALLGPGAVIEVLPAGWRLTGLEDQRQLLTNFLPQLGLGSSRTGQHGAIDLLTVWLAPAQSEPDGGLPGNGLGPPLPIAPAASPVGGQSGIAGFFARHTVARVLGVLGGVLLGVPTFIAASNGLVDTLYRLRPDLQPDGPPAAIGITLSEVELEERRVLDPAGDVHNLVSYDVELVGYRGSKVPVEWAAFEAASARRVNLDPMSTEPPGNVRLGEVTTEAANDRFSGNFLIPIPGEPACVVVRVYVYEDDAAHTRQDYRDSAPFDTHFADNRTCGGGNTGDPAA